MKTYETLLQPTKPLSETKKFVLRERDLFDLIRSLSKDEIASIKKRFYVYEKDAKSAMLYKLFEAYLDLPVFDESRLRKTFDGFSRLKGRLWDRIMEILQSIEQQEVEVVVNRKLDYVHLLIKKDLKEQAYQLIQEIKDLCHQYDLHYQYALALKYEASIVNYIADKDILISLASLISDLESIDQTIEKFHKARLTNLDFLHAEISNDFGLGRTDFDYGSFLKDVPSEAEFADMPLQTAVERATPIIKAYYHDALVEENKKSAKSANESFNKAFQVQGYIEERFNDKHYYVSKGKEKIQKHNHITHGHIVLWNWLRNQLAMYEDTQNLERISTNIKAMERLLDAYFKNDQLRTLVLLDIKQRYWFLSLKHGQLSEPQQLEAQQNLAKAKSEVEAVIKKYPSEIRNQLMIYQLANLLNVYAGEDDVDNFVQYFEIYKKQVIGGRVQNIKDALLKFETAMLLDKVLFSSQSDKYKGLLEKSIVQLSNFVNRQENKELYGLDKEIIRIMEKLPKLKTTHDKVGVMGDFVDAIEVLVQERDTYTMNMFRYLDWIAWGKEIIEKLKQGYKAD